MNHKLRYIVSIEIYIYIYSLYADADGMLLHRNGKSIMRKLKSSLLSSSFLISPVVNFYVKIKT